MNSTDLDWTRTGPPFPARFHGECPHPDCPHDGVIAPGERIVRLRVPKYHYLELEGIQGRHHNKRVTNKWAHVGCTVEAEPGPVSEKPECRKCGASLLADGEVLFRCPFCGQ